MKIFKIKHFRRLSRFKRSSDTLLSTDVLENLRDKCIEIDDLDLAHFCTSAGLAWFAVSEITIGVINQYLYPTNAGKRNQWRNSRKHRDIMLLTSNKINYLALAVNLKAFNALIKVFLRRMYF